MNRAQRMSWMVLIGVAVITVLCGLAAGQTYQVVWDDYAEDSGIIASSDGSGTSERNGTAPPWSCLAYSDWH